MTNQTSTDPSAIVLKNVRLSYPHLFVPRAYQGPGAQAVQSAAKYQTNILIPKTDKENLLLLQNAYKAAIAKVAAAKFGGKVPPDLKKPWYDGDGLTSTGKEPGEECQGHFVLSAKSSAKPPVYLKSTRVVAVEEDVWAASLGNQMDRLGKTLGFAVDNGVPGALAALPREALVDLVEKLSINWLANDGIWFQAVERRFGMGEAKRSNDTCWTRFSPFEAMRIKRLLGLPERGGIPALKQALALRMYAFINEQSIEEQGDHCIIFYMNQCRVQAARQRKGLADYPCKSAGMVEYPTFARAIDPRIRTECVGCPPDPHPQGWFCAWKFTLEENG